MDLLCTEKLWNVSGFKTNLLHFECRSWRGLAGWALNWMQTRCRCRCVAHTLDLAKVPHSSYATMIIYDGFQLAVTVTLPTCPGGARLASLQPSGFTHTLCIWRGEARVAGAMQASCWEGCTGTKPGTWTASYCVLLMFKFVKNSQSIHINSICFSNIHWIYQPVCTGICSFFFSIGRLRKTWQSHLNVNSSIWGNAFGSFKFSKMLWLSET